MEVVEWVKQALSKWNVYTGRSRRREYWSYTLAVIVASIVVNVIDSVIGLQGYLGALFSLVVLVPGIFITIRRLHDVNKSGWWLLLYLVPVVGWLVVFIFTLMDSQPGENQFGANPKGM